MSWKISHLCHNWIIPVYNGPSTDGPLSVYAPYCTILKHFFRISLWQFIFFHVALFSCRTFFILHHFHVSLICVDIFPCCTFFRLALFLCIALFHGALLQVAMFSFCILLLLDSSHIAIFSYCTFFMLHYF